MGEAASRAGWTGRRRVVEPGPWSAAGAEPEAADAGDRSVRLVAVGVGVLALVWAVASIGIKEARVLNMIPSAHVGVETASALARLLGALVLFLFPDPQAARWLRWVAAGLLTAGVGQLAFGTFQRLLGSPLDFHALMYASLGVWIVTSFLLVVGLVPARPPRFAPRPLPIAGVVVGVIGVAALAEARLLPQLIVRHDLRSAVETLELPLPGLTGWHWGLGLIPLGLTIAAAVGAERHRASDGLGGWLVVALVLAAGAQLHSMLWPTAYTPVLASTNLLRLAFAGVVSIGAVLELRRIAAERASLLDAEREAGRRQVELATLRSDFGRIVAHELGSPIAAIRVSADMLATGDLTDGDRSRVLAAIRAETDALHGLVGDVWTMATVERDGFAVHPRPVSLAKLLGDAAATARTLPGDHLFRPTLAAEGQVLADPVRIDQVLRNLLGNAAKYAPPGTPIDLRATRVGERVRIEVIDGGPGIPPEHRERMFEKFSRLRARHGGDIPGAGLGLYLSRRIVEAHGQRLTVGTAPTGGAVFGFELEIVG